MGGEPCGDFENVKDVLDVLVVPLVIFGFGLWLPRLIEKQKRQSFFSPDPTRIGGDGACAGDGPREGPMASASHKVVHS